MVRAVFVFGSFEVESSKVQGSGREEGLNAETQRTQRFAEKRREREALDRKTHRSSRKKRGMAQSSQKARRMGDLHPFAIRGGFGETNVRVL